MWEFIKYCFFCVGVVISAAFGHNPPGLTLKNSIVGLLSLLVLGCTALGIMWLIAVIRIRLNNSK